MKIKLKSDFLDYYDHWFDNEGIVFERMSRNNLSRSKMFALFDQHQIKTPKHGKVKDLVLVLDPFTSVVVYLDEFEHQGKGKIRCSLENAMNFYPDNYASQYIPSGSISYRELFLGDIYCVLKYSSDDVWRSNVGNVEICLAKDPVVIQGKRVFDYPIYAIDYIPHRDEVTGDVEYLAIDLNTSPMVRGTGLEKVCSAEEVAVSIKEYILKRGDNFNAR